MIGETYNLIKNKFNVLDQVFCTFGEESREAVIWEVHYPNEKWFISKSLYFNEIDLEWRTKPIYCVMILQDLRTYFFPEKSIMSRSCGLKPDFCKIKPKFKLFDEVQSNGAISPKANGIVICIKNAESVESASIARGCNFSNWDMLDYGWRRKCVYTVLKYEPDYPGFNISKDLIDYKLYPEKTILTDYMEAELEYAVL